MQDYKPYLEELLTTAAQQSASDLHLSPGSLPVLRVDGRLVPLTNQKILDPETLDGLASVLLGNRRAKFMAEKELDFSYTLEQKARFRVNIYYTEGSIAMALRIIPDEVPTLDSLNLPPVLKVFGKLAQGLVLITGPYGHGKTTTLAGLVNLINKERGEKIITIESPIEYIFTPDKSIVDQREVYQDTFSAAKAVRSALREDANIIMIGELRDADVMSAALHAAETGHLVIGALAGGSSAQVLERIIDNFPAEHQMQARNQLSASIAGIISQRLVPRIRGGMIPAVEVMIATTAIRTQIRDNKLRQIDLIIETSQDAGMMSLDRSLAGLVRQKEIMLERAEFFASNPAGVRSLAV